jgi:hypothetical protein
VRDNRGDEALGPSVSWRTGAVTALVAAAGLLLLTGGTLLYAHRELADSGRFADRLASTLDDGKMRMIIARRVTAAIERARPDLSAARPAIKSAVATVVASSRFRATVRAAAARLHASVFARSRRTVTLTVHDVGAPVVEALRRRHPELAGRISQASAPRSVELATVQRSATAVADPVKRFGPLGLPALVVAALAAGAAVMLAGNRWRALTAVGLSAAAAGAVGAAGLAVARAVVLNRQAGADSHDAAAVVWDAYLGALGTWCLVALGCGLIVAAAAFIASSATRPRAPRHVTDGFSRR